MNRSIRNAGLVLVIGMSLYGQAEPQTMYRCGKQYQDRPCEGGQQGRAVGNANPSAASANPNLHSRCAQRGLDSMKISWAREGGVTQDTAMQGADSYLVREVYQKRGSAAEVRAAIEADCQREQDKIAERAAALRALGIEGAGAPPAGGPQAGPASSRRADGYDEGVKAAAAKQARLDEERAAARKAEQCRSLNDSLQSVRSQQRTGGSASRMESLNEQHRQVQRRISEAGC